LWDFGRMEWKIIDWGKGIINKKHWAYFCIFKNYRECDIKFIIKRKTRIIINIFSFIDIRNLIIINERIFNYKKKYIKTYTSN